MENAGNIATDENNVLLSGPLSNRAKKSAPLRFGKAATVGNVKKGLRERGRLRNKGDAVIGKENIIGSARNGRRRALGDITNARSKSAVRIGKDGKSGLREQSITLDRTTSRDDKLAKKQETEKTKDILELYDKDMVIESEILGKITLEEVMQDSRIPRNPDGTIEDIEYMPAHYETPDPPEPVIELDEEILKEVEETRRRRREVEEMDVLELLKEDQPQRLEIGEVGDRDEMPVDVSGIEMDLLEDVDLLDVDRCTDIDFLDKIVCPVEQLNIDDLTV